jgi:hypothetical protein
LVPGVVVGDGVVPGEAVAAGVEVGAALGDGVGVGVVEQADALIVSSMRVTSPFRANTRPFTVTPEPSVIVVNAMTVPTKVGPFRVAELPTCQNTLHADAPPVRLTVLLVPAVRVDPVWKMKTALGSPSAFRVRVPVRPSAPSELVSYTPGARVSPVRSAPSWVGGPSPAAWVYAVVRSFWAPSATLSAAYVVDGGSTMPGGKPVTAEPGSTPKSPEIVDAPVLVTVVPAKTAKGVAVARFTVVAAAAGTAPRAAQMATVLSPSTAAHQRGRRPTRPLKWSA